MSDKSSGSIQTYASSLAGLLGSSIGKSILHPIDTIKAKLQVLNPQTTRSPTSTAFSNSQIYKIVQDTLKNDGIKGLYRGYTVHILGSIPAAGLYFGSYELFKSQTLQIQWFQNHAFMSYLLGGMFAEAIACAIFVPVDVIKERRQVQSNMGFKYKGDLDAIKVTVQNEGVRGLYRAYGATVLSFGPFSALYFYFYETFKGLVVRNDVEQYLKKVKGEDVQKQNDISMGQSMLCSMAAGAMASVVTNPLDMGKLRLQVQRAAAAADGGSGSQEGGQQQMGFRYKHLADAVFRIGREEGILALFRGSLARCMFHIPMTAVSMSVLEVTRPSFVRMLEGMNK